MKNPSKTAALFTALVATAAFAAPLAASAATVSTSTHNIVLTTDNVRTVINETIGMNSPVSPTTSNATTIEMSTPSSRRDLNQARLNAAFQAELALIMEAPRSGDGG